MPNGKRGDDPFTDILHWKILRYSSKADTLIAEIVQLGGRAELERTFKFSDPPSSRNSRSLSRKFATVSAVRPSSAAGRFNPKRAICLARFVHRGARSTIIRNLPNKGSLKCAI